MPYAALDPLALIGYTVFFAAVTLLTMRRPAFGLCALIVVQPFAYYHDLFGTTITLEKIALLGVLLGVIVYADAFAPVGERASKRILYAGLFVLLATVLSFAQASYHAPVIREALKALEYVVLFCVCVAAFRLDPDRSALRAVFLIVPCVVAALALAQEVAGAPSALLLNGHVTPRIAGPLEGPNQLAGYFDIALPIVLALALQAPTRAALFALLLIACTDVLTFSRGGALGAIVAVIALMLLSQRRSAAPIAALACGALAGVGIAAGWGIAAHSLGIFRLWNFESTYAGGVGTRPKLWHAAVLLWRQHPWLGIGAGNFELEIPRTGLYGIRTHANSLYLQSLVEGGIPLLAATLWLTYVSIVTFARERLASPFVAAACAASIALALHQVVDFLTFYPKVGGEWWLLMGIAAAELSVPARVKAAAACA